MSEWRHTTLGGFLSLQRGHDLPQHQRRHGTVPVVGSGGITGFHDTAVVRGPGITIGRAANLGVPTLVQDDFWPLNTTLYVTDFHGNDVRFAYYLLRTLDLTGFNSGSVQPMLNRNHIRSFPVTIPPPAAQRAISAVLGAIDDKIAVNERIARAGSDLAVALGQQALAAEPGHDVSLGDVAGFTKGVAYRRADLTGGDGVLISLKSVGRDGQFQPDGAKPFSGEAKPAQILREGDIVVAQTDLTQRAGVIGRPARVVNLGGWSWMVASLDLAIARPANGLTSEALFAVLASSAFRDHALSHCNGTTVLHLGGQAFPAFRFRKPADGSIARITTAMRPLLARADAARRENQPLARLRDTLLPELLSGAIRVRDAERTAGAAT